MESPPKGEKANINAGHGDQVGRGWKKRSSETNKGLDNERKTTQY